MTPEIALNIAVGDMAALGYLHPNIEWRHVGLMPIFDAAGSITALRPILIDMEGVSYVGDVRAASSEMGAQTERLIGQSRHRL
jgi:hypothetical protein